MTPDVLPALKGLRVLVVEDEVLIADDIAMTLEAFGCEIVGPVPTVAEALAAVRGDGVDGALLDANLRGESTANVAAELRDRGIPFVVVTGYSKLEIDDAVLNAAPRLAKPFSEADFIACLVAAFG